MSEKLQKFFLRGQLQICQNATGEPRERHRWRPLGISQGKKRLLSEKLQKNFLRGQLQICQNATGEPRGRHRWRPLDIFRGKIQLLGEKLQKIFLGRQLQICQDATGSLGVASSMHFSRVASCIAFKVTSAHWGENSPMLVFS